MNGVMRPDASPGSNQVGASEIWTAQVSVPFATARAGLGVAPARPVAAVKASKSRRVMPVAVMAAPPSDFSLTFEGNFRLPPRQMSRPNSAELPDHLVGQSQKR